MKTGYKVCDAMTKAPIFVPPETSIGRCAQVMNENNVGSLLVKKGTKLIGIITDQDIVRKIIVGKINEIDKNDKQYIDDIIYFNDN